MRNETPRRQSKCSISATPAAVGRFRCLNRSRNKQPDKVEHPWEREPLPAPLAMGKRDTAQCRFISNNDGSNDTILLMKQK